MMLPITNPHITLHMTLDQFNNVQGILAKRPFDEIADLVLMFRAQVGEQLAAIRAEEAERQRPPAPPEPPPAPPKLHLAEGDG